MPTGDVPISERLIALYDDPGDTKVALPAQSGRRDLSYRGDQPGHGMDAAGFTDARIPSTRIPEEHHVVSVSPVRPPGADVNTRYDADASVYVTTVFPTALPSSRRDVALLEEWMEKMLASAAHHNDDPIALIKETQGLYSICLHELVRQVSVHCFERGKMLSKVWRKYVHLFRRVLELVQRDKSGYWIEARKEFALELKEQELEFNDTLDHLKANFDKDLRAAVWTRKQAEEELRALRRTIVEREEKLEAARLNEIYLRGEIRRLEDAGTLKEETVDDLVRQKTELHAQLQAANPSRVVQLASHATQTPDSWRDEAQKGAFQRHVMNSGSSGFGGLKLRKQTRHWGTQTEGAGITAPGVVLPKAIGRSMACQTDRVRFAESLVPDDEDHDEPGVSARVYLSETIPQTDRNPLIWRVIEERKSREYELLQRKTDGTEPASPSTPSSPARPAAAAPGTPAAPAVAAAVPTSAAPASAVPPTVAALAKDVKGSSGALKAPARAPAPASPAAEERRVKWSDTEGTKEEPPPATAKRMEPMPLAKRSASFLVRTPTQEAKDEAAADEVPGDWAEAPAAEPEAESDLLRGRARIRYEKPLTLTVNVNVKVRDMLVETHDKPTLDKAHARMAEATRWVDDPQLLELLKKRESHSLEGLNEVLELLRFRVAAMENERKAWLSMHMLLLQKQRQRAEMKKGKKLFKSKVIGMMALGAFKRPRKQESADTLHLAAARNKGLTRVTSTAGLYFGKSLPSLDTTDVDDDKPEVPRLSGITVGIEPPTPTGPETGAGLTLSAPELGSGTEKDAGAAEAEEEAERASKPDKAAERPPVPPRPAVPTMLVSSSEDSVIAARSATDTPQTPSTPASESAAPTRHGSDSDSDTERHHEGGSHPGPLMARQKSDHALPKVVPTVSLDSPTLVRSLSTADVGKQHAPQRIYEKLLGSKLRPSPQVSVAEALATPNVEWRPVVMGIVSVKEFGTQTDAMEEEAAMEKMLAADAAAAEAAAPAAPEPGREEEREEAVMEQLPPAYSASNEMVSVSKALGPIEHFDSRVLDRIGNGPVSLPDIRQVRAAKERLRELEQRVRVLKRLHEMDEHEKEALKDQVKKLNDEQLDWRQEKSRLGAQSYGEVARREDEKMRELLREQDAAASAARAVQAAQFAQAAQAAATAAAAPAAPAPAAGPAEDGAKLRAELEVTRARLAALEEEQKSQKKDVETWLQQQGLPMYDEEDLSFVAEPLDAASARQVEEQRKLLEKQSEIIAEYRRRETAGFAPPAPVREAEDKHIPLGQLQEAMAELRAAYRYRDETFARQEAALATELESKKIMVEETRRECMVHKMHAQKQSKALQEQVRVNRQLLEALQRYREAARNTMQSNLGELKKASLDVEAASQLNLELSLPEHTPLPARSTSSFMKGLGSIRDMTGVGDSLGSVPDMPDETMGSLLGINLSVSNLSRTSPTRLSPTRTSPDNKSRCSSTTEEPEGLDGVPSLAARRRAGSVSAAGPTPPRKLSVPVQPSPRFRRGSVSVAPPTVPETVALDPTLTPTRSDKKDELASLAHSATSRHLLQASTTLPHLAYADMDLTEFLKDAEPGTTYINLKDSSVRLSVDKMKRRSVNQEPIQAAIDSIVDALYQKGAVTRRPLRWVRQCIAQIYRDKAVLDKNDDRQRLPRQSLKRFTYEWFITRFGLKALAEKKLAELLSSVLGYLSSVPRVRMFARFLGLGVASAEHLNMDALNLFLFLLHDLQTGASSCNLENETATVPLMRATDVTAALFRKTGLSDENVVSRVKEVERFGQNNAVDADALLEHLVENWVGLNDKTEERHRALFVAGDLDGSGKLDFGEFVAVVTHADPSKEKATLTEMFMKRAGDISGVISLEDFLELADEYNLAAWKPAGSAVFADSDETLQQELDQQWRQTKQQVLEQMTLLKANADAAVFGPVAHRLVSFKRLTESKVNPMAAWYAYHLLLHFLSHAVDEHVDATRVVKQTPAKGRRR